MVEAISSRRDSQKPRSGPDQFSSAAIRRESCSVEEPLETSEATAVLTRWNASSGIVGWAVLESRSRT